METGNGKEIVNCWLLGKMLTSMLNLHLKCLEEFKRR